ncbi:MAG: hypothetical protein ABSF77_15390 [Spirochaetia bacterium]
MAGKGQSEEEKAFDRLVEYRTCEETELLGVVSDVLIFAERGKYPIARYPYLYSLLKYLNEKAYLDKFPTNYVARLTKGIESVAIPQGQFIEPTILTHSYFPDALKDEIFQGMVATIKEKVSVKSRIDLKTKVESFLDDLNAAEHAEFIDRYNELRTNNLFQTIAEEGLQAKFLELNNGSIYRIEIILHDRFVALSNAAQIYGNEKIYLEQLAAFIESHLAAPDLGKMRSTRLRELATAMRYSASKLAPIPTAQA